MNWLRFLRQAAPALGFGFLLAFASSPGQTFFIALFGGEFRSELSLSHGAFGGLYTLATTLSAIVILWAGKLIDHIRPWKLGLAVLLTFGVCSAGVAAIHSALWLGAALFALRFLGQGLLSHIALTSIARWFDKERGRAMSVTMLGYTTGQAALPVLAAALLQAFDWRVIWIGIGAVLAIGVAPAAAALGRAADGRTPTPTDTAKGARADTPSWTRADVLRDPRFYAILPGVLAPPFILTGLFFHQTHLVDVKGWTLTAFAALYPIFAASSTASTLAYGWAIDRFGSARALPFYLAPLAAGLFFLSVTHSFAAAGALMALMGLTAGAGTLLLGTLWAELYGLAHLGAIKAMLMSLMVFATAAAPGAMGLMIDAGVGLNTQFRAMSIYLLVCVCALAALAPALAQKRAPGRASLETGAG